MPVPEHLVQAVTRIHNTSFVHEGGYSNTVTRSYCNRRLPVKDEP